MSSPGISDARVTMTRLPGRVLITVIRIYQRALSPLKPPACRFYPTCSQYFIEALEQRGFVRGCLAGIRRLSRCHPFCAGGYDPVEPLSKKDATAG